MKNIKKNWIYWGLGLVFLIVVLYMSKDKIESAMMKKKGLLEPEAPIDSDLELSKGSKGAEVAKLQRLLNADGEELKVDGIFGPLTETALYGQKGVKSISLNEYALIGKFAVSQGEVIMN
jgi:hypothetical protein